MPQDSTHSIFDSAKRFFSGTMLSRISGMLRDMAMAFAFGTQDAVAAFMVAFRFSHLLRRLFGEGALQTAFIPQFEALRTESQDRAYQFFRDLWATLSAGLTLIIIIAMSGLGASLYFFDFSPDNREIVYLTLLMMPSLLFICLFGLNASLLQCERSYFMPGVAPVAFNLVWIAGVFCICKLPIEAAMPWLAGCVIIACIGQWLITVPQTLAILKRCNKRPWEGLKGYSEDLKKFSKPLFLGIFGVAASQINNAMDSVFARYADLEGPAMLWYALRLQQLPLALFGIAIAGALLPPLSRALKGGDFATYRHFLEFALRRSFALMLPITIALLVLGDSSINLIYGHGDFNDNSTIGTTRCLWAYGLGLIPATLVLILAPAFYSRGDYRTPTIAATVSMALNILLNTLLIAVFHLGAASVAIATSVSSLVNCAILASVLHQDLRAILTRDCLLSLGKLSIASALAGIAVVAFANSNFWPILNGYPVVLSRDFMSQFSKLALQAGCFTAALAAAAWLSRTEDITHLLRSPKKKEVTS